MPRLCSSLLLSLGIASSASAVTMDWTPIGNPGNACDPQPPTNSAPGGCFGAVGYGYSIGTYEVTNAQYAEFLNAKAKSDRFELYNTSMADTGSSNRGGISRSGSSGSYTYSTIAGRENLPVNQVSFYDALRFANWMNNGQGNSDTETGAYTLLGGPTPSNGDTVTRNAGATIALPTEDEWYKAAYYDAQSASYFLSPAGSEDIPTCTTPSAAQNTANCDAGSYLDDPTDADVDDLTPVGSFPGSPSPYGAFDQGGNVWEWNEALVYTGRGVRGGAFDRPAFTLDASWRDDRFAFSNNTEVGIRVAMIPEPGTAVLVIAGLLGLAIRRRVRA